MNRTPTKRRPFTLGEHLFWTIIIGTAVSLMLAVTLFVGA